MIRLLTHPRAVHSLAVATLVPSLKSYRMNARTLVIIICNNDALQQNRHEHQENSVKTEGSGFSGRPLYIESISQFDNRSFSSQPRVEKCLALYQLVCPNYQYADVNCTFSSLNRHRK